MSAGQLLRRPGVLAALATILVVALIWGGTCTAPDGRSLPAPSSTSSTEPAPTTSSIDLSRVVLERVPGETTTTLVASGRSTLQGVVVGPDGGAVPAAVVRVERLVGDAVQAHEVRAGQDGAFVIPGLPGGRMRVRAYLPPSLTMTEPAIFFQTDGEARDLRLELRQFEGTDVQASTTPRAPTVGSLVNLAVRVTERVVDDRGIATARPVPGLVVAVRATGWTPVGASAPSDADDDFDDDDDDDDGGSAFDDDDFDRVDDRAVTDGDGVAVFTFRCDRVTAASAIALVGTGADERSVPVEVPSCGPRPTTTTTTSTTSTTVADGATTTTEDG